MSKAEAVSDELDGLRVRIRETVRGPDAGCGDRPTRSSVLAGPRVRSLSRGAAACWNSILGSAHGISCGGIDVITGRSRISEPQRKPGMLIGGSSGEYAAFRRESAPFGTMGYELGDCQRRCTVRGLGDTGDRKRFGRSRNGRGHPRISTGSAQDAAVSYLEMVADDGRREMLQDLDRPVDSLIECDWLLQACGLESVFATPEDVDGQDDPEG